MVAAGGSKASDVQPQGTRALMQSYEDTEGNFGGLYMLKKDKAGSKKVVSAFGSVDQLLCF